MLQISQGFNEANSNKGQGILPWRPNVQYSVALLLVYALVPGSTLCVGDVSWLIRTKPTFHKKANLDDIKKLC